MSGPYRPVKLLSTSTTARNLSREAWSAWTDEGVPVETDADLSDRPAKVRATSLPSGDISVGQLRQRRQGSRPEKTPEKPPESDDRALTPEEVSTMLSVDRWSLAVLDGSATYVLERDQLQARARSADGEDPVTLELAGADSGDVQLVEAAKRQQAGGEPQGAERVMEWLAKPTSSLLTLVVPGGAYFALIATTGVEVKAPLLLIPAALGWGGAILLSWVLMFKRKRVQNLNVNRLDLVRRYVADGLKPIPRLGVAACLILFILGLVCAALALSAPWESKQPKAEIHDFNAPRIGSVYKVNFRVQWENLGKEVDRVKTRMDVPGTKELPSNGTSHITGTSVKYSVTGDVDDPGPYTVVSVARDVNGRILNEVSETVNVP